MFKESKDPDMSVYKWQLPVKQSNLTDLDWIHPKAKYHCFDKDGFSLCGKFYQDIYYFETDLESEYECDVRPCEKYDNDCSWCKTQWGEDKRERLLDEYIVK